MKVSDIMTHPVLTVIPETTVGEVAELMIEHRISGLPVVNPNGDVVGIVTEGDLLRRAETGTERRRALARIPDRARPPRQRVRACKRPTGRRGNDRHGDIR